MILYAVVALMAASWLPTDDPLLWIRALPAGVATLSLVIGLPVRVTVGPRYWRWMCRARNVALCAAALFLLVDLVAIVWFIVALNETTDFA